MNKKHASRPERESEEPIHYDACYFVGPVQNRQNSLLKRISPTTIERLWSQEGTCRQVLLDVPKDIALYTILRKELCPIECFVIRVQLDADTRITAGSIAKACADAAATSKRPRSECPKIWKYHRAVMHKGYSTELAIALDEPRTTFHKLLFRIGGPLTMSRLAQIPVSEAVRFLVLED